MTLGTARATHAAAAYRPRADLEAARLEAARRLHRYLVARHWRDGRLVGPDPGVRFNYRIWRFVKSAAPRLPWNDDLVYQQAQGYWVLTNWALSTLASGDERDAYVAIAVAAADRVIDDQGADGSWPYPNPEWRGRVATAEGTWACIGLLETYRRTGEARFLEAARRWRRFVDDAVGFQVDGDAMAVNYFAGRQGSRVPNNAAFYLRFLAEMARAEGEFAGERQARGMVAFLASVQKPSGEFPYAVAGLVEGGERPHFQCYQYNAFIALDLFRYAELTGDAEAREMALRTVGFLASGLRDDGAAAYACDQPHRTVTYHTAALAAAFAAGADEGLPGAAELAERAYAHVLAKQRPDGGFPHSSGDYRVLADRRSYPRYLTMIAYHLLRGDLLLRADAPDASGRSPS